MKRSWFGYAFGRRFKPASIRRATSVELMASKES